MRELRICTIDGMDLRRDELGAGMDLGGDELRRMSLNPEDGFRWDEFGEMDLGMSCFDVSTGQWLG
jgi:hypothetical protein